MIATANSIDPERHEIPLLPLLGWNTPCDHVQLFAGPIGYRTSRFDNSPVPGRVVLFFRYVSHLDWIVDLDQADREARGDWEYYAGDRELGEVYFDFGGVLTTVPAYTSSAGRGFVQPAPMLMYVSASLGY
jgi:hypothetical protein